MAELRGAYATEFRIRADELSDEAIAAWLSDAIEAVRPLPLLAEAKLDHIITPKDKE